MIVTDHSVQKSKDNNFENYKIVNRINDVYVRYLYLISENNIAFIMFRLDLLFYNK